MNPLWIVLAFAFGFIVSKTGLPPLVGYLCAGFALNLMGIGGGDLLNTLADAGVTLLLFTIGLKLKIKHLVKPEIWGGTSLHMIISIGLLSLMLWTAGISGVGEFAGLDIQSLYVIAFALSFSSTVFAVKILEEKQEMMSRHSNTAIGILIMQDIIAVVFMAASSDTTPSPWAPVLLIALFILKPVIRWIMGRCGHGELLLLFGILMAVAGYSSFEWVNIKGDLGALVIGMMIATHPKASELADRLLGFKDLFLIGFFLTIGLSGLPDISGLVIALLLALFIPIKTGLFFIILTRFKVRARTSLLSAFSLSNYSEFGLIVGAVSVSNGWITGDWLGVMAVALSISFIIASPLNMKSHSFYSRFSDILNRFETDSRLPEDNPIDTDGARLIVLGMGKVGTSAYDEMRRRHGDIILGIDFNPERVNAHRNKGRHVIHGDASDSDFWKRLEPSKDSVNLVMLAFSNTQTSLFSIDQMSQIGFPGQVAASVRFDDEIQILKDAGINAVYSLYEEAGVGFADHACTFMDDCNMKDLNT